MITDKTDTAYVELYSPDAELLIPFTAATLKQAEEENRSVTPELQLALDDRHVVCYINTSIRWFVVRSQGNIHYLKSMLTKMSLVQLNLHQNNHLLSLQH